MYWARGLLVSGSVAILLALRNNRQARERCQHKHEHDDATYERMTLRAMLA